MSRNRSRKGGTRILDIEKEERGFYDFTFLSRVDEAAGRCGAVLLRAAGSGKGFRPRILGKDFVLGFYVLTFIEDIDADGRDELLVPAERVHDWCYPRRPGRADLRRKRSKGVAQGEVERARLCRRAWAVDLGRLTGGIPEGAQATSRTAAIDLTDRPWLDVFDEQHGGFPKKRDTDVDRDGVADLVGRIQGPPQATRGATRDRGGQLGPWRATVAQSDVVEKLRACCTARPDDARDGDDERWRRPGGARGQSTPGDQGPRSVWPGSQWSETSLHLVRSRDGQASFDPHLMWMGSWVIHFWPAPDVDGIMGKAKAARGVCRPTAGKAKAARGVCRPTAGKAATRHSGTGCLIGQGKRAGQVVRTWITPGDDLCARGAEPGRRRRNTSRTGCGPGSRWPARGPEYMRSGPACPRSGARAVRAETG
jgi:hypothetical protein